MRSANYWIDKLQLQSHPEGGFFREIYRSKESIAQAALPERYTGARAFCTSIYYLLKSGNFSAFHRIKSDEIWHFYAGDPLVLYMISPRGDLTTVTLGHEGEGQVLQTVIPAGFWFGARLESENSYSLLGCTVAPGFDFDDFELADAEALMKQFPDHHYLIELLTR